MDPDTEVESFVMQEDESEEEVEEEKKKKKKWMRPPSSYGSMRSDSDVMEEEETGSEEEVPQACSSTFPVLLPEAKAPDGPGMQMIRSESPETVYTTTTEQTKPPGAVVIDTRSSELEEPSEDDEEGMDELLVTNSPVPPEPIEPDDTMLTDEHILHPEQRLSHIFKSIQGVLTDLNKQELFKFKMSFYQWEKGITLQQMMDGDILDFVDRMMEILGPDRSLLHTISTLESVHNKSKADELWNQCKRALIRFHLEQHLIRKHQAIREGVIRAGKQSLLNAIYVEPQISTCGYGGVDPSHELRPHAPSHVRVPSADTFITVNDLFRLQKCDGQPVRTVLTTGIPGIGMSVIVGKFSLDWAERRANKDLQFVIKLSFRKFWLLRNKKLGDSQKMSIVEMIEYHHPDCKDLSYLDEEDCKFLIIMDSFDCYQAHLDWENAPVINDSYTQAHPDVLIVNIVRGTVLRGAHIWILGRRAAVSHIPSHLIDTVTEIQGFSDEMKDDYLTKRFSDAELARKIVAHYKCLPTLRILARQPFFCWMMATMFERCYRYQDYGVHPPRLTPFYISFLIVQTNRRLQFYDGKDDNEMKWSSDDVQLLMKIGKMAFKMLEKNTSVFSEVDMKDFDLRMEDVTVFSGMCTELPSDERRMFCFIHFTFQEFMAALYVFTVFRLESTNILDSGVRYIPKIFTFKDQTKSAESLIQCAITRTLSSPLGHYDMFLRFLCGLLSPYCHDSQLRGYLYRHNVLKVNGLGAVKRLLEQAIETAQTNNRDRVENLKECLREMTQADE